MNVFTTIVNILSVINGELNSIALEQAIEAAIVAGKPTTFSDGLYLGIQAVIANAAVIFPDATWRPLYVRLLSIAESLLFTPVPTPANA